MDDDALGEGRRQALSALENSERFIANCLAELAETPIHRGKVRARWILDEALAAVRRMIAELSADAPEDVTEQTHLLRVWISSSQALKEGLGALVDEVEGDSSKSDTLCLEALETARDDANGAHMDLEEHLEDGDG
jgi:hypothetical protein